jgi:hypothetical protein
MVPVWLNDPAAAAPGLVLVFELGATLFAAESTGAGVTAWEGMMRLGVATALPHPDTTTSAIAPIANLDNIRTSGHLSSIVLGSRPGRSLQCAIRGKSSQSGRNGLSAPSTVS